MSPNRLNLDFKLPRSDLCSTSLWSKSKFCHTDASLVFGHLILFLLDGTLFFLALSFQGTLMCVKAFLLHGAFLLLCLTTLSYLGSSSTVVFSPAFGPSCLPCHSSASVLRDNPLTPHFPMVDTVYTYIFTL